MLAHATLPPSLLLSLATTLSAGGRVEYENVIYPLAYNFAQEAGTVEIWVRPDLDLTDHSGPGFYHFFAWRTALGKKTWGEKGGFALIWRIPQGLYTFGGRKEADAKLENTPVMWPKKLTWDKGSWHHLAFTWQRADMALYADGELLKRTKASGMMPRSKEGFWVVGYGNSRIAVDELGVSSVPRPAMEITRRMQTAPEPDEFTLILDPMDTLEQKHGRWTKLNPNRAKVTDGKFGKAIQLHRLPRRP